MKVPILQDSLLQLHILEYRPYLVKSGLVLMFLLAALIRLDELQAPGVLVEREYTSAIFARAFYFDSIDPVEPWRQQIARQVRDQQPVLEPPVTEFLVSLIYRIAGHEQFTYARYLTSAFWLIAGIFMYLLTRGLLSMGAALFATAYFLFVPRGVLISRSFQPDSLMMMLFLISLFCILRYFQWPSMKRLLLAATLTGLTLLLRPLVLFALFGAFAVMSVEKKGNWKQLIDRPFMLFYALSLIPPAAYYGYGIVIADFMRWKVSSSFRPYLLARPDFWLEWFDLGASAVGYAALGLALVGFSLLGKRYARALIIGLALGYVVFGVVFTFHIHTHGYYHAQLFPIIAICSAQVMVSIFNRLQESADRARWLFATAALLVMLYSGYVQVKYNRYTAVFEEPSIAREVGELVEHSSRTVFVAHHYGLPLQYYGQLAGVAWPKSTESVSYDLFDGQERSVQERLALLEFTPEYFVVTDFKQLDEFHQDLAAYLATRCLVLAQTTRYVVYQACDSTLAQE